MSGLSLEVVLPVISQVMGRDVKPDVQAFFRARTAVGSALNEQGQKLFQDNWRSVPEFMETEEGKAATVAFLSAWAKSLAPKIVDSEPATDQREDADQDPAGIGNNRGNGRQVQHGNKGGNNRR